MTTGSLAATLGALTLAGNAVLVTVRRVGMVAGAPAASATLVGEPSTTATLVGSPAASYTHGG